MKLTTVLCALTTISVQAAKISYTLDFYGDSISKSLIRNNYIESKNDTQGIREILDFNNLTWESAKKLPVGKVYYISKGTSQENEEPSEQLAQAPTTMNSQLNDSKLSPSSNQFDLELGTFHHTQSVNKANVYSDLSQYLIATYERNSSYGVNLKLERYQYSNDDDQNIASDKTQTNYEVSAFRFFNFKSFRLNAGAYIKSLLSFELDSLNRVEFDTAASNGVQVGASSEFFKNNNISLFAGLKVQKNASGSKIEDYQGAQVNSGLNFKYLKRDMSLVVRYEFSQMEIEDESLGERKASLGLKSVF